MQKDFRLLAEEYLNSRTVCDDYAVILRGVARRCQHVSAKEINAYLKSRLVDHSTVTVANERRTLMTLWRWAWETGVMDTAPRGVMRIRQRPEPVRAWSMADIPLLLKATKEFDARIMRSGVSRGLMLRCWILLGYETGARYSDIWAFRDSDLSGSVLRWQTHKTGVNQHRPLSARCLKAVDAMLERSPDGRIIGWACKKGQSMNHMRELLATAGLPGTSKWLRRSSATHVEIARPGKAKSFLGHKSPGMADRHYIDRAQIASEDIVVPSFS